MSLFDPKTCNILTCFDFACILHYLYNTTAFINLFTSDGLFWNYNTLHVSFTCLIWFMPIFLKSVYLRLWLSKVVYNSEKCQKFWKFTQSTVPFEHHKWVYLQGLKGNICLSFKMKPPNRRLVKVMTVITFLLIPIAINWKNYFPYVVKHSWINYLYILF